MPVPTRRLALVAVLAAVVRLLLPADLPGGLWAVNAVLLVVAVVDGFLATSPAKVDVTRSAPAVVALNTDAELVWRVTNTSTRRIRAHVADELAPSLGAQLRRFQVDLPPRGT